MKPLKINYEPIIIRYFSILVLTFIFLSNRFQEILSRIFTYLAFQFLDIFFNVSLEDGVIFYNNDQFLIINACIGASAYILLTLLFLSLNEKRIEGVNKKEKNKNEMKNESYNLLIIFKVLIYSLLIFTIINFIRIILLMLIYIIFGYEMFDNLHMIFYEGLTGIITALIYILFYKYHNFTSKPIFTDLVVIFKQI